MTDSAKTTKDKKQMSEAHPSAVMVLLLTALDTSIRAFVPTIGGTFLGIGLDKLFGTSPILLIVCLTFGTIASILLIAKQLRDARKPL